MEKKTRRQTRKQLMKAFLGNKTAALIRTSLGPLACDQLAVQICLNKSFKLRNQYVPACRNKHLFHAVDNNLHGPDKIQRRIAYSDPGEVGNAP